MSPVSRQLISREGGPAQAGESAHLQTQERVGTRYDPVDEPPAWAEVDLDAVRSNTRALCERLSPGTGLAAVVKCDGYGHGALPVAWAAAQSGAAALVVSHLAEARELRAGGLDLPIILLTPVPPGAVRHLAELRCEPVLSSLAHAIGLAEEATAQGHWLHVHAEVDTGMGRLGFRLEDARAAIHEITRMSGLKLRGLMTHLPSGESPAEADAAFTQRQLTALESLIAALDADGLAPRVIHAANTGAALRYPQSHYHLVRTGLGLYGLYPHVSLSDHATLRPALTLKTRVALVKPMRAGESVGYRRRRILDRDTRIAILPVGYARGYPRVLSDQADVLIQGQRVRVLGLVSMDLMAVDVGLIPAAHAGDEAVLLGSQGAERITAEELADAAQTINYEIVTQIGNSNPRVYLNTHPAA